jgi:hypothetical protein
MSHRLATFLFPNDVGPAYAKQPKSPKRPSSFLGAGDGRMKGRGVRNVGRLSAGHHVNEASRLGRVDLFLASCLPCPRSSQVVNIVAIDKFGGRWQEA